MLTPEAAKIQQDSLRTQLIHHDDFDAITYVAGVDVGFKDDQSYGAIAVLRFDDLSVVDYAMVQATTTFPYIPGLLAFREVPILLAALQKVSVKPDLLICDGHGMAHPRRFGLACHLGVKANLPAIGVGKSHFIGQHEPVPPTRGAWQPLQDNGEVIGAVLRTQTAVRPIYVSVGHRVSLQTAVSLTLHCSPRYRLPETTRQADHLTRTNKLING